MEYKVAFENIDFSTTVEAESPHDAVWAAVDEIPAYLKHKIAGGAEVLDPEESNNAFWFEPTMEYVESENYSNTEPILDHE